jgi:hypothetical protein
MSRFWLHFRRYSAWSLLGVFLFVVPVLPFSKYREDHGALLTLVGAGGSIFVLIRAAIGIATGWSPALADRATAKVIGLFMIGWIFAFVIGSLIALNQSVYQLARLWTTKLNHYPPAAFLVIGGLAAVVTGCLTTGKRGWIFFPLTWLTVSSAILVGLLALSR